jgi:hypothetical protein
LFLKRAGNSLSTAPANIPLLGKHRTDEHPLNIKIMTSRTPLKRTCQFATKGGTSSPPSIGEKQIEVHNVCVTKHKMMARSLHRKQTRTTTHPEGERRTW